MKRDGVGRKPPGERRVGRPAPSAKGRPRRAGAPARTGSPPRIVGSPKAAPARAPAGRQPAASAGADAGPVPAPRLSPADVAASQAVQILSVAADEAGMRLDRFLSNRFPTLALTHIQRIVRKGEVRVSGHRAKPNDRIEAGWGIRVPPLRMEDRPASTRPAHDADATFLRSLVLYEDEDIMVLNKPFGLAVQGGSGTHRHVDGLLESLRARDGQKPRLVHRLDKDTAGCLVVAMTRFAAAALAKSFRSRATRKIYWALVAGVPKVRQGRVSTYLAREEGGDETRMAVSKHGQEGASHALTYYALVDKAAQKLAWLSLKPVTGRTHQLRAHAAHIGHPIVGDPKYFDVENWELPGGIQNRLHLLARRIVVPHPRTGRAVDVTAPLPAHMQQSFNLLGFDTSNYDPIEEAPEA